MPSTFFTTDDGDVILRAGTDPGSKHDFRIHKLILSLASPVFKDMFSFPQPPNQNKIEQPDIPIVDVPDSPQVLDTILRFVYPGVELPKFTDLSLLSALLSAADKYNIASMLPVLRDALNAFIPENSFSVYATACRFGFSEEAKAAAMVSTPLTMLDRKYEEEVRHLPSAHLLRFLRFVIARENVGRSRIRIFLDLSQEGFNNLGDIADRHWDKARGYYSQLTKVVEDTFVRNPCVELKDLLSALDRIPDPPLGCKPEPEPAGYYRDESDDDAFSCPLQPMFIRRALVNLVRELDDFNHRMLEDNFGEALDVGGY